MTQPVPTTLRRNFYGRRHGKALRPRRRELLETRLDALAPPGVAWADNPDRRPVDPAAFVPGARDLWIEVGFGAGEHLVATAAANRDVAIVGCEPFVNGVAALLAHIERERVENVRIHAGDARDLLDVLPEASVGRAYVLYPDPWPKRRHWRRRFVNPETLVPLARALRPGAELRVATDIDDYVRHTLERVAERPEFDWMAERPEDWREPWKGWPGTRYEAKALREGRRPTYLRFRRR